MNNCLDPDNMDNHRTQTETEISNDREDVSYELNLFDDQQKLPDDELTCDSEIFGDLFIKIKVFREKNDFILEWEIFNEFFNLMEKHENNLTDKNLSLLKRGLPKQI
jgi:hypothetical protein